MGYLISPWSEGSLQVREVSSFSLPRSHHYRWAAPSSRTLPSSTPTPPATPAIPPPSPGTAVGCDRQALQELRSGGGGCSRRPGGRRREAVPQFVSNQGVRAVPRAGQQCVNKPSGNSSAPLARSPRAHRRRLRRHRHGHRGLRCRRPFPRPSRGRATQTPRPRCSRLATRSCSAPPARAAHLPPHARALVHHAPRAARPERGLPRAR